VVLKKAAIKNLRKIDARYKPRINLALFQLARDPFIGKKLDGELSNFYSIRVWPYRIVYHIVSGELIVVVAQINHRQGVYK